MGTEDFKKLLNNAIDSCNRELKYSESELRINTLWAARATFQILLEELEKNTE